MVLGKEGAEVIAVSELAMKYQITVPEIILATQQHGYTVLGWDQYLKLLDEIGNLIGGNEESLHGTVVEIQVSDTDSPQEAKVLPKNSPP